MTLVEMQKEIIENRTKRGWESAHNLDKTTAGLYEEIYEWEIAVQTHNRLEMIDALGDTMVFALGGAAILDHDAWVLLDKPETLKALQREELAMSASSFRLHDHDLAFEPITKGLYRSAYHWIMALKADDHGRKLMALRDIMRYCLKGLEILEVDAQEVLDNIITINKNRDYAFGHH